MVKIFACVSTTVVERLTSQWGPLDHRSSVIPTGETIHPVFLSFERLVELREFESKPDIGFLDNRRVVAQGKEVIEFKTGSLEFHSEAPEIYRSAAAEEFFLTMRRIYRSQLRRMCQLRRLPS